MFEKLDIYNLALSHLKEAPLVTITDNRKGRTECDTHYDIARLTLLKKHDWSFARQLIPLVAITPDDDDLIEGYDYYYELPDDYLALRGLYVHGQHNDKLEPKEFYLPVSKIKVIVSNCDALDAICTVDIEDTTLFDVTFFDALTYELASRICSTITGDDSLSNSMKQISEYKVLEAKNANLAEQYKFQERASDTLASRG